MCAFAIEPSLIFVLVGAALRSTRRYTPTGWAITYDGVTASLWPSVGNWSEPCMSHYLVENNKVRWSRAWSREEILGGRAKRRRDIERYLTDPKTVSAEVAQANLTTGRRASRPLDAHGWMGAPSSISLASPLTPTNKPAKSVPPLVVPFDGKPAPDLSHKRFDVKFRYGPAMGDGIPEKSTINRHDLGFDYVDCQQQLTQAFGAQLVGRALLGMSTRRPAKRWGTPLEDSR